MLRFVRRARSLGFSVQDVGALLALWSDEHRQSMSVKRLVERHLQEIEHKIDALDSLRRALQPLVDRCHGDHEPDCPILEDLASPSYEAR